MKFKTVAEAFNHYRTFSIEDMRKRAQEIQHIIDTDANADVEALNIELRGIKEARENAELRSAAQPSESNGMKIITGADARQQQGGATFGEDVFDSKEYRSAFYKHLLGQQMTNVERAAFNAGMKESEKRADAFTSAADAMAVIPTTTLNEIVKKARTMGGLLAECRAFSMPSKISIPVGTPSGAAAWHVEGETVEGEKLAPASITFDGNEIIKIFSISAKARRMSIPAFEAYLVEELAACVMQTIEAAIINGTGVGQGTGLENGVTWITTGEGRNCVEVAANKGILYSDIVSALAMLKRGYSNGAKFAMNNATLYNAIYNLLDGDGRPIFIINPQTENIGKLFGRDVVIDDNIADDVVYLGNFAQYMGYNLPEGIVMEVSRESSFRKGLIDYRAMAIADCKPIVPEAFIKICKASA